MSSDAPATQMPPGTQITITPGQIPAVETAPPKPKTNWKQKLWRFIDISEVILRYCHGALKGIKEAHQEIERTAPRAETEDIVQKYGPEGQPPPQ